MSKHDKEITWGKKLSALARVSRFRPKFTIIVIVFGITSAGFEGIGLSFIYPILEVAQSDQPIDQTGGVLGTFEKVYEVFGIPFTLEYLIVGVSAAMTVRFVFSFVVGWLRAKLQNRYEQNLKQRAFNSALAAKISYFDQEGSDNILNGIITETSNSAQVVAKGVRSVETFSLMCVYFGIMFYIAPFMTVYAMVLLGGITYILRYVVEPAYTVGDRVATANERLQQSVQAGTQGVRDVKIFTLSDEIMAEFDNILEEKVKSRISLVRNKVAIQNLYDLATALSLFSLIYVGFVYSGLALGALGIFLLAMFRLSPLVSRLNSMVYDLEGTLSHLIRTQKFLNDLEHHREEGGSKSVSTVSSIEFDNVSFGYTPDEPVLSELSFEVSKGEFIAFVGKSGAGKSTIVSLISRLYDPDDGQIRADGTPVPEYELDSWRERIAVVRQQPFIFNDTLKNNITIANRDAKHSDIKRVCEISKVDEFIEELPNGYDSQLGDDGVRLSGGQRQRVALARALLKDADFLLLDEATSDLDSDLEKEVQAKIESMDRDYGIIAIAHRLSTVKNANQIYTVENGKITESGTHQELLAEDGEYANLYTIQASG